MADLYNNIVDWLMQRALHDEDLAQTIDQLGTRLIDGGLPIQRIALGRVMLHPVIGVVTLSWSQGNKVVDWEVMPRHRLKLEYFEGTPFGELALRRIDGPVIADLKNPEDRAQYPLFDKLFSEGVKGYLAFRGSFDEGRKLFEGLPELDRGAMVSFCTKRFSGFSASDIEGLQRILPALFVCARMATERFLATELLETYLGRISGREVLAGYSARGDGRGIQCALFYSDMRNSVSLSQTLDTAQYLHTLNQYFDCTSAAVLDHGGEVLKYIGDGILAIFPFDDATRPRENMCRAALEAAREAVARAEFFNEARRGDGLAEIEFGISLHVGEVIYGNVGTESRLDFTATGAAVGMAARAETLTRDLGLTLLATEDFAAICPDCAQDLGPHELRGFDKPVMLHTYSLAG